MSQQSFLQKILLSFGVVPGMFEKSHSTLRLAILGLLLAVGLLSIGTSHAQSALDGFNPNADSSVLAIAVQADGKILMGGFFTTVSGQPRNRIARLNADGTLDASFNPDADDDVRALAVQEDGKILVGGLFTNIGGQSRNRIARLNADGTVDAGFDQFINSTVFALAVQEDGKILAGGNFTSVGEQTRNHLVRFNADGTVDNGFNPDVNNDVRTLAVQPDGKILVGGAFNTIGGQSRSGIARLNADGTLDTGFNPGADNSVFALALQADGKIVIGGAFSMVGGQARNYIARINADGTADTGFNPDANNLVFALAIQVDGKIVAGGTFTSISGEAQNHIARINANGSLDFELNPNADNDVLALAAQGDGKILAGGHFSTIGGETRNFIARLYSNGLVEIDINPNANDEIFALAAQADGKILVGGKFTTIGGFDRYRLTRLDVDGTVDSDFSPNADGEVLALAVQADGKILVGGNFTNIAGEAHGFLARLNENGTADASFTANADNTVQSLAVQPDGKILVGGNFTSIAGADRSRIVRLNADGTLDGEFNSAANSDVQAIAIQPDGKIVIGGFFTAAAGEARNRIARLNVDGTLDMGFNPDANENVDTLALQPDGKILAGGNFTNIGGQARNHLARLNTNGTADAGFDPNVNGVVYALSLQTDGGILLGGSFASVGGQTRNGVARINANGALDAGFDPNAGGVVFSMVLQADGTVMLGGSFTSIGGQSRNRIARLTNEVAFQTISANSAGTTLTWTRGGTSPQVDRVTFEQSTDFGENWTSLGDAVRVGTTSNWQLTGLSLPFGQNLLLRARGYPLTGGFGGGDPSVYESVQLVYLPGANTAPSFLTVATLSRQQGSAALNSTIATVDDAETNEGFLTVTAVTVPEGITVTNIFNIYGTITADVAASCSAAIGSNTVVLEVSDGSLTSTANLTVNVSANTPPMLTYDNANVFSGASTTINSATGPSDNGGAPSITLLNQGTYSGTISVNGETGGVSISNAAPDGTHTITVRATDNCGAMTDASFMLTVEACSISISPEVQSFSAAGGNGTITVLAGGGVEFTGKRNIAARASAPCNWSVVNNAPAWITVTDSGSGFGNDVVEYTVSPNAAPTPRSGTLTIAGETFVVTQIAAGMIVFGDFSGGIPPAWEVEDGGTPAVYDNTGTPLTWTTLNPCSRVIPPPFSGAFAIVDAACTIPGAVLDEVLLLPPFDATGLGSVFVEFYSQFEWDASVPNNKGDVDVSTDGGMTWTNVLRLENGSDGVPTPVLKSLNITPYITANPANVLVRLHYYGVSTSASLRRAALGKAHWGVDFGVYSYAFTPSSQSFPASGGTGSIAVSTSVAVPTPQGEWTAVSNVPWITVTSGASMRGNGTVTFTVGANAGGLRTGTLTISGRTFTVTQSCVPSPAGLISWYAAEDNASDRQGSNNGTLHNSATFAAGFVGKAFSLDGVNDSVSTMLDAQPSALPNTTWEAWVYPTLANHDFRQSIFSTDDGGFDRAVTIEAGTANFGVFTGAGVWEPVAVTLNQWQHIAIVYTATEIEFYKDGVKYIFDGEPAGQATVNRFTIGRNPSAAGEFYQGLVDEAGVYNRALTQAEIQTVVTASSAGRCGVCPTTTVGPENSTLPAGTPNQPYSQTFTASGGDAPYIFTLNTGTLPDGLAIAPDGVLSGTPTNSGTFNFTVRTTDVNGCSGVGTYSLTIRQPCETIIIGPAAIASGSPGSPYSQQFTQSGGTGSLTFSTPSTLPIGIALSSGGLLAGTTSQTGSFPITIRVIDSNGCMGMANYTLVTGCSAITLSPLPNGTAGAGYNQTISVTPAGTYNFTVTSGALPPGLTLNAGTGAITGIPTSNGSFIFTIAATSGESGNCIGSRSYTLAIGCQSISFLPTSLPAGAAGNSYSQTLTVTPAGAYTFSLAQGSLPSGLLLNGGTGALSGSPSVTGTYNFSIKAQSANGCNATQAYSLVINCPGISLTPAVLPNGTAGAAYSQSLSASPAGGGYSFSITAGALPTGLTLNPATGALSGTPKVNGTFAFTVKATGFGGCMGSQPYTVVIGGGGCPTITLPASLSNGSVGQFYNQSVAATPAGSYSYVVANGSLPPGVTLFGSFGLLYGYPTVAGSYTFTIQATGSSGCTASQSYTILINGGSLAASTFNDFSGDHQSDFVLWRANEGQWLIMDSATNAARTAQWGQAGDLAVPGDYDGDGKADLAAFGKDGHWRLKLSSDGATVDKLWGLGTDVPVPGDYDGDGKTDIAVWRGALGHWYILRSSDGETQTVHWGTSLAPYFDRPVPGDYDGDGSTDAAVFRQSTGHWYIKRSSDGQTMDQHWGLETDVPVPGDYDGDGKTDIAVWRGAEGAWYIINSADGAIETKLWGAAYAPYFDAPAAADYDGDGKVDLAVWRKSKGHWYVLQSSDGAMRTVVHGRQGDQPVMTVMFSPRN